MTKQTRRSISVKESTYQQLEAHAQKFSTTKSGLLERIIAEFFASVADNKTADNKAAETINGSGLHLL